MQAETSTMLGIFMLPLACSIEQEVTAICITGRNAQKIAKYALASAQIAASPPSQWGRKGLISSPRNDSTRLKPSTLRKPLRMTARALA